MAGRTTGPLLGTALALFATGPLGCAGSGEWIYVPPDGWDARADDGGTVEGIEDVPPDDDDAPEDVSPAETDGTGDVPCGTGSFPYGNTQEAYTAPPGARYMYIKAWGAGGNGEAMSPGCALADNGGIGGYTEAVYELVGEPPPMIVIVGGKGHADEAGTMFFGWGQDGGGGLSGVFIGPDEITPADQGKALVVAGGGGGTWPGCVAGGTGNHPEAGGQTTMMGARSTSGDETGVNGGGGGYHGGDGGGRNEPGMGGTGYVDETPPAGLRYVRHRMLWAVPGSAEAPNDEDPDYPAPDYEPALSERAGRVVIHFTCEEPPLI